MEDEELDASTNLEKAKKLAKMKNAMAMVDATQCLSCTPMLNAIFNVQAAAGWPTGRACQLFDDMKHKYNTNDKLLSVQMMTKLNEIKPRKRENPKVMCEKTEALKVK